MSSKKSFKTMRRTRSDTDSDYPDERDSLLTPAYSTESKKSLNVWGQLPIPPTALFYDSETSDFEATSTPSNNINTGHNTSNNGMYQNLQYNLGGNNRYNNKIRKPQFHQSNSNQIFSYSSKYTKYNTITSTSPESEYYTQLRPVDCTDRFYCPVASMIPLEEDKIAKTFSKTNGYAENGIRGPTYKSNEADKGSNQHKQSSLVTIFSIWNTMVGTTLLAMPWGMERAGLPAGFVIAVIMGGICLYSAYCNINTQELHGAPNGEIFDLTKDLIGKWAEVIAKIFSYLVLLGAVIIYWILLSNFLNFVVDYGYHLCFGHAEDHPYTGPSEQPSIFDDAVLCPRYVKGIMKNKTDEFGNATVTTVSSFHAYWNLKLVPIYLAGIIGPIICMKSPTFFTKFTSLGTLSVMFLMLFVFIKAVVWGFVNVSFVDSNSIHYGPFIKSSFGVISGMLSLSYFIHNIIIPIMRNNRSQEHNARDISIAYLLVMTTYIFIGALFYVSFPLAKHCIEDNILNNFRVNDPLSVIARAFLFFQLLTVYPLLAFLLRTQILTELTGSTEQRFVIILPFNIVLVTTCVLFAIFLPHIGVVIRFTGALSGFVHVFSIPILLRIASLKKRGQLTLFKLLLNLVIPVLGAINIILQFIVTER